MKQTEEFEKTMEETAEMIPENSDNKETPKNKKAIRDLIVVILIFAAFPIVLRGGGGLLGIVIAALIVVAAVVMLPVCVTLGLGFAGVMQIVSGFSAMRTGASGGSTTMILGFGMIAVGVVTAVLSIKLYKKLIPWVIRKLKIGSK